MAELKKCFVIAPIGADDSKERLHSNDVLEFIINPVITPLGFEPGQRADHLGMPGDITRQILDRIVNDDLVIADLTGHNPNVFYELAIRHVVRKPYIHLIKAGERIPFDVAPQRTVFIEPEKVREIERAKKELATQVSACMANGFEVESPVSITLAYDRLKEGSDSDRTLAVLMEQVGYLVGKEKAREEELIRIGAVGPQGPQGVVPLLSFDEVVRARVRALMTRMGFDAQPPPEIMGEILADLGTRRWATKGSANLVEIDAVAQAVIEHRLMRPVKDS